MKYLLAFAILFSIPTLFGMNPKQEVEKIEIEAQEISQASIQLKQLEEGQMEFKRDTNKKDAIITGLFCLGTVGCVAAEYFLYSSMIHQGKHIQ